MMSSMEQVAPVEGVTEVPPRPRLTSADYWKFVNAPENAARQFELFAGELYEMPSPTFFHARIVVKLIGLLLAYLREHPVGEVVGDNLDMHLAEGYVIRPDVGFFSTERAAQIKRYPQFAPDFVVEVASPSNSEVDLVEKMRAYIKYGARLVWIVFPEKRMVWTHEPGPDDTIILRTFEGDAVITGGAVLPGFTTTIAALLPELPVEE